MARPKFLSLFCTATVLLPFAAGCASKAECVPTGYLPPETSVADALLPASYTQYQKPPEQPPAAKTNQQGRNFELPPGLPGGNQSSASSTKYPDLPTAEKTGATTGEALSLSALQTMASSSNSSLRQAQADADAAYGAMIQAGLYPNPVVGYQADQMQPWAMPTGTVGQQGAYFSQVIKTAGKLGLAQQIAGYDYLNSLVSARRTQVDVISRIRTSYFAVLVAQQSVEINTALVTLADEVYQLQRKQVRAGEAAAYEPMQLYAQSILARNNVAQAQANVSSAWRQLAASIGQPQMKQQPLSGKADAAPPVFQFEALQKQMSDEHTELLAARNRQLQAQANLRLQEVTPIPDLQSNLILQYDNVVRTTQFGVQLGVQLPLYDRNQGNIRQAQAKIASAGDAIVSVENDLLGRLAEARGRYESNKTLASNYRDLILPNLTNAYRAMIRRYQVEPDKVQFNDIVVAQQNLAQAMQTYLSSIDSQWKAVVDIATLAQLDELYPAPAKPSAP